MFRLTKAAIQHISKPNIGQRTILISCIQTLPYNDFVPVRQQVGSNMHEHRHGLRDFATLDTHEVVEGNRNLVPLNEKSLTKVAASYNLCNAIMEKINKVKNKSGVVIGKDKIVEYFHGAHNVANHAGCKDAGD